MRRLFRKILNRLNGLYYKQEYLCTPLEEFQQPLYVYFCLDDKIIEDVSKKHLFIGYKPVLIAITNRSRGANLTLLFSEEELSLNTNINLHSALAYLSLKEIEHLAIDGIKIFEGINVRHSFISRGQQFALDIYNRLFNNKPGNVYLESNLFKQVQLAYTVPRKICLITIADNGLYNLFPTDLHGEIEGRYIISLRTGGKACQQVEQTKKILLSDIDVQFYKEIYALGKNHMKDTRAYSNFSFSGSSGIFGIPIPEYAISYKELELTGSHIHGIHTLLQFKIIDEKQLSLKANTLAHIHNLYATWRHHKNIETTYYLR